MSRKRRDSYGYQLTGFGLMWPHILGRLEKELDTKSLSTLPLNRCGSATEGGRSQATKKWQTAPGVTTTVGGMAGHKRTVENNHVMVELLWLLLDAFLLAGNFS